MRIRRGDKDVLILEDVNRAYSSYFLSFFLFTICFCFVLSFMFSFTFSFLFSYSVSFLLSISPSLFIYIFYLFSDRRKSHDATLEHFPVRFHYELVCSEAIAGQDIPNIYLRQKSVESRLVPLQNVK